VGKSRNQKITEAEMLLFHKSNITPSMKASNARSNLQVGVKHIPDDGLMRRNAKELHYVPIKPSARLLLVIPSTYRVETLYIPWGQG
jgi:hypothetical protein